MAKPSNTPTKFVPNQTIAAGSIIASTSNADGWWVCINTHVSGNKMSLKPGESNGNYHWSQGPS